MSFVNTVDLIRSRYNHPEKKLAMFMLFAKWKYVGDKLGLHPDLDSKKSIKTTLKPEAHPDGFKMGFYIGPNKNNVRRNILLQYAAAHLAQGMGQMKAEQGR